MSKRAEEEETVLNSDEEFEKTISSKKRAKKKTESKREKFFKKLTDEKIGVQKIRNQLKGTSYKSVQRKYAIKKLLGKYEDWTKISFPENSFDTNLKTMETFSAQISSYIVELEEEKYKNQEFDEE